MDNNDHEGWRGFRIDQIKTRAKKSVEALRPTVFTVNAGSNDCVQDFRLDSIEKRIDDMLEYLWRASPRSTIILSTLLVNTDDEIDSRLQYVNDRIRNVAGQKLSRKRRIVFVDMRSNIGPQLTDLVDGTHPNDEGYEKMAAIFFQGIQEAEVKGFLRGQQADV